MKLLNPKVLALLLFPFLATAQDKLAAPAAPYQTWQHSGTLTILTTPEGADLPASAAVEGFPLLVRLSGDWFDFKQVKAGGEDVRFSTRARSFTTARSTPLRATFSSSSTPTISSSKPRTPSPRRTSPTRFPRSSRRG